MQITEKFDDMNPIEKLDSLNKNNKNKEMLEKILIALYTIDKVIKEHSMIAYAYYLNSDDSLKYILEKSLVISIDDKTFMKSLIELDMCKLIYRFTCAKKFKIEDETHKQLRLNSWGNEYIKCKNLLHIYKSDFEKIYTYFNHYYIENENIYIELLQNLLLRIDDCTAEVIKKLNKQIEIKILS